MAGGAGSTHEQSARPEAKVKVARMATGGSTLEAHLHVGSWAPIDKTTRKNSNVIADRGRNASRCVVMTRKVPRVC
jgi:hypothetical protein